MAFGLALSAELIVGRPPFVPGLVVLAGWSFSEGFHSGTRARFASMGRDDWVGSGRAFAGTAIDLLLCGWTSLVVLSLMQLPGAPTLWTGVRSFGRVNLHELMGCIGLLATLVIAARTIRAQVRSRGLERLAARSSTSAPGSISLSTDCASRGLIGLVTAVADSSHSLSATINTRSPGLAHVEPADVSPSSSRPSGRRKRRVWDLGRHLTQRAKA